ncbi:MAG: hypothetical protein SGPRY_014763, partial [Prymnesium sp.]
MTMPSQAAPIPKLASCRSDSWRKSEERQEAALARLTHPYPTRSREKLLSSHAVARRILHAKMKSEVGVKRFDSADYVMEQDVRKKRLSAAFAEEESTSDREFNCSPP